MSRYVKVLKNGERVWQGRREGGDEGIEMSHDDRVGHGLIN
jgi:hypothetical protein